MLRRISRNPDGGVRSSLSGAILPGCASLVVPLLAVTALELPAAAIDRIAAPLLGRSADGASLFRPPAATSAHGSSYGADGTYRAPDQLVARDHVSAGHLVAPSASSTAAALAREQRNRWVGRRRWRCLVVDRGLERRAHGSVERRRSRRERRSRQRLDRRRRERCGRWFGIIVRARRGRLELTPAHPTFRVRADRVTTTKIPPARRLAMRERTRLATTPRARPGRRGRLPPILRPRLAAATEQGSKARMESPARRPLAAPTSRRPHRAGTDRAGLVRRDPARRTTRRTRMTRRATPAIRRVMTTTRLATRETLLGTTTTRTTGAATTHRATRAMRRARRRGAGELRNRSGTGRQRRGRRRLTGQLGQRAGPQQGRGRGRRERHPRELGQRPGSQQGRRCSGQLRKYARPRRRLAG